MGKNCDIISRKRSNIVTMCKLGYLYEQIAKNLNISNAAAGMIGKSFEECGSTECKRQSGRPG